VVKELIDPEVDVESFFQEAVRGAARAHNYDPEAPSTQYLVGLLADYARPETLHRGALDRPLALLLSEALETAGPERFRKLQGLGDDALYLSGFFADHLERRGTPRTFAQQVGANAYDAASAMLRRKGQKVHGPDVFDELASNFASLVEVLGDVADSLYAASARDPRGVLELYERWSRRGSQTLAAALVRVGVMPTRGSRAVH